MVGSMILATEDKKIKSRSEITTIFKA